MFSSNSWLYKDPHLIFNQYQTGLLQNKFFAVLSHPGLKPWARLKNILKPDKRARQASAVLVQPHEMGLDNGFIDWPGPLGPGGDGGIRLLSIFATAPSSICHCSHLPTSVF